MPQHPGQYRIQRLTSSSISPNPYQHHGPPQEGDNCPVTRHRHQQYTRQCYKNGKCLVKQPYLVDPIIFIPASCQTYIDLYWSIWALLLNLSIIIIIHFLGFSPNGFNFFLGFLPNVYLLVMLMHIICNDNQ